MSDDYVIYIPTFGRTDRQWTWPNLPSKFKERAFLVCVEEEVDELAENYPGAHLQVQPPEIKTIAQKRAWLIEQCPFKKMIMLDDDLKFCLRISEDSPKLRTQTKADDSGVIEAFDEWLEKLDEYVHAGLSPRQANHTVGSYGRPNLRWVENTRMIYALGYQTEIIQKECELGRIEHREDMDYTLQLLRKGYPNAVAYFACCTTYGYGAVGGASTERSMEASNADAWKLAKLHPGLVSVKERNYERSQKRLEVKVSWKKAYKQGVGAKDGFF